MKITSISAQKRGSNRVNISVDGKYRFSLNTFQIFDLGIKVGKEYDESEIINFEEESQFGKIYSRALEYCLSRPHSAREVRDYLYRKSRPMRDKSGKLCNGISKDIAERVFEKLSDKGYIDDLKFTYFWVENRSLKKGISKRKLTAELIGKGINKNNIEQVLSESVRNDDDEIEKIIEKKRTKYSDDKKLMSYLASLGFSYDVIKNAISADNENNPID